MAYMTTYGARVIMLSAALLVTTIGAILFAPRIDDVTIVDNHPRAAEAPPDTTIRMTFSRPVDKRSAERAFVLYPVAPGRITWLDDRTLEFVPTAPLKSATTYRVFIRPGLRDTRGHVNRAESQWLFTIR